MELLNNIWIALCTPNEALINIINIPLSFVTEAPLIMYIFIYSLNITASRKQKILYIIISSIVGVFATYVIPSPFNVVINYCITILIIHLIFKLSLLKSFLAMIIPAIVFALLNVFILNPFLTIFNISYEQVMSIPIYRYSYMLILYVLLTSLVLILKQKKTMLIVLDMFDKNSKLILLINLIFGLLAIIFQLFLTVYYINAFPVLITIVSSLSLFLYFAISIYSLTRVSKLAIKTQELESAEAYNKSLSILHDNVRGFKHDFDNIVATIGGYVKTDDIEGLKNYYLQLEDDCQRVNNIATLNPSIINNPGIFNLLSIKYHKADSKNIKINLEFFLDLNTLNMKIYEFSRILGILLDNAIEEAEKCEEKIINIKFRNEQNQNRQVIIVENTYSNKDIDINEIFNKGFSSKTEHQGLGLWEIRQILNKNNNINLHTTKNEKFFKQQLEIYLQK